MVTENLIFKFIYNWSESVYQILVNYLQQIKILSNKISKDAIMIILYICILNKHTRKFN